MRSNLFVVLTLGLVASTAFAAPKVTSQSIIVNPSSGPFRVQAWVNKDRSGEGNPSYRVGEKLTVSVRVNEDAYVYLFNVTSNGKIDLFTPNRFEDGNFVRANTTKTFGANGAKYELLVGGPAGQDKLLALASTRELTLNDIVRFVGEQGFAQVRVQGQDDLARALSVVVNEVPDEAWTTDTVFFRVVGRSGNAAGPGGSANPAPAQPGTPAETVPVSGIAPGERRDGSFDEAVVSAYERTRGPESLGTPTTFVEAWGDGVWQKFRGVGSYGDAVVLHANGSSRAYAVHGMLLERYLQLARQDNGEARPPRALGWAAGDEKIIPRNSFGTSGLYGFFQRGALYGTERYGTFVLTGELLRVYQGLGGSGSFLGFPTRDQGTAANGRDFADFEGGSIRWDGAKYRAYRK